MERLTIRLNNGHAGVKGYTTDWEVADRLAHYEELEEQGRLVELPCAAGDTVYYIAFGKVYEGKCHAITVHKPGVQVHLYDFDGDNASYATKDVFLSRAEAEVALSSEEAQ